MRGTRRGLAPLTALLLGTLSCGVMAPLRVELNTPEPADGLPDAPAEALAHATSSDTPEAAPADPVVAALLEHLVRYQRRSGLSLAELEELAHTIAAEARHHDLDPALVIAVMHVESLFDTYAVSNKDAMGLMQLLPSTGAWLAPKVGVEWVGPQTLFDPVANVKLGVAYLRQLTDRYDGNVRTALLAYNWGPGRIDRRLRKGVPLPREYAQLVFAAYGARDSSS